MKRKINDLENAGSPSKSYMEAIKTIDTKIQTIIEKTDNTKRDITKEARKIIGIYQLHKKTWNISLTQAYKRKTFLKKQ